MGFCVFKSSVFKSSTSNSQRDPISRMMDASFQDFRIAYSSFEKDSVDKAMKNAKLALQRDNLRKLLIEHEENKPKKNTVKISWPKEGKPYFRDEVLDFIIQKVSLDKLVGLGPLNQNNIWLANFFGCR